MVIEENFRVDFIGIGAAKSGTTWLADALRKHPQIFLPVEKEISYFGKIMPLFLDLENHNYRKPYSWYHNYFKNSSENQINGEFSTNYMVDKTSARRIFEYNPKVKIIALLRNPVHRAFSDYTYYKQKGYGNVSKFEDIIPLNSPILTYGFYYEQLKPYFDVFPKEQIKVLFFEDIVQQNRKLLKEVYDFLKIDVFFPSGIDEKANETKKARFQALNYFITRSRRFIHANNLQFLIPFLNKIGLIPFAEKIRDELNIKSVSLHDKEKMDSQTAENLKNIYLDQIIKLEELLDVDLSRWK